MIRLTLTLRLTFIAAAATLSLSACATTTTDDAPLRGGIFGPAMEPGEMDRTIAAAAVHPLGSEKNPVRVNMPGGERFYLERLRCANGRAPAFARSGSVGIGVYGNVIDLYGVQCPGSTPADSAVYMDMYFADHVETAAVPGFTIVAP